MRRLTVHPHTTGAQDIAEASSVAVDSDRQNFTDRRSRHGVAPRTRRLTGGSEEAQNSHTESVPVPLPSPWMSRPTNADTASRTRPLPTRLLVARHGQSEWNASGRWQGQADAPLSDEGMRQAAGAGLELGVFDAVWASDLQRASLTAGIIAEIIGIGPVLLDVRLRETDVGPWQGLTHAEVEAGWPGYLADHRRPVGFEDYDHAAQRMMAAFRDIAAASPGGEVLVVSHGGAIRSVRRALGAADTRMPNLGASWFTVRGDDVSAGDLVNLAGAEPTGMAL